MLWAAENFTLFFFVFFYSCSHPLHPTWISSLQPWSGNNQLVQTSFPGVALQVLVGMVSVVNKCPLPPLNNLIVEIGLLCLLWFFYPHTLTLNTVHQTVDLLSIKKKKEKKEETLCALMPDPHNLWFVQSSACYSDYLKWSIQWVQIDELYHSWPEK